MAITGGIACSSSYDSGINNSLWNLNLDNTISGEGYLTSICVKVITSGGSEIYTNNSFTPFYVKAGDLMLIGNKPDNAHRTVVIVRDDGTYYRYIGSVVIDTPNALDEFGPGVTGNGAYCTYYYSYDGTGDVLKSWWNTSLGYKPIIYVSGGSAMTDVYINSSTGSDSYVGDSCTTGHPVLTFAKAYLMLTSGGTIHVCNSGADFSAETVTMNKSFSIDLNGSSGNFYGPKAS